MPRALNIIIIIIILFLTEVAFSGFASELFK